MNLTDQTTVAVVDDDLELGALIGDYLQTNGFKYRLFEKRYVTSKAPDVGLPGMDVFRYQKR